jgi:hypothetical protein
MSAQAEFRMTLLIGLGGAGQEILLRTKRLFLDTYGAVPPCVKMLSLDTDGAMKKLISAEGDNEYSLTAEEFLHLKVDDPAGFLRTSADAQQWHADKAPVGAINAGAGAVRQTGRLAFFFHINEIRNRLDELFTALSYNGLFNQMEEARFKLADDDPDVYVCGSIAGGTGSGIFLDMGILLRHLRPNALVHGLFLSFWPYRGKPFAHRVKGNAYAALTELDNLQSIMYGDETFQPYHIKYAGDCEITVQRAPYDIFHIIDGRDEFGSNKGSVEEICENLADAVFLSLSRMAYPTHSAVDNLRAGIAAGQPTLWAGRYPRYSSIGVSCIHYPARELHRAHAAANAVRLCSEAIGSLESGAAANAPVTNIEQDLAAFIRDQNLTREQARAKLCPDQSRINLVVESYEIADPDFPEAIKAHLAAEQRAMENRLDQQSQTTGEPYLRDMSAALAQKLSSLALDRRLDAAYRFNWCSGFLAELRNLTDSIAQELQQITTEIDGLGRSVDDCLELAVKSRPYPLIGGRKGAVHRWADQASDWLTALKKKLNLEKEQRLFAHLRDLAEAETTKAVPSVDEIHLALARTKTALLNAEARAKRSLDALKARQSYILLGGGHTVIADRGDGTVGGCPAEELYLQYPAFTEQQSIHHAQAYLDLDRQSPGHLAGIFLKACETHLEQRYRLSSVSVSGALRSLAEASGNPEQYAQQQFTRLFKLAGALWYYDHSQITADRGQHLENIWNLGFHDHEQGRQAHEEQVEAARHAMHVNKDPSYSATGDPSRIWLLNFAAVLPAYAMSGLGEARRGYDNEITPSYHVDKRFEMEVPDLFPTTEIANRVLRVLGMAIVKGIDVIVDTKKPKGHEFTFKHGDTERTWWLFRELYDEIKDDYSPKREDNLLDLISRLLKEKVESMPQDTLVTALQTHIAAISGKLAERDFSRLYSARLTYRELKELELFLDDKLGKKLDRKGYGLDIDRYLEGRPR